MSIGARSFKCHQSRRVGRSAPPHDRGFAPHRTPGMVHEAQPKRGLMPSIDIQVLEGVFSDDDKARIIEGVTQAFGAVAGETIMNNTSVRIHEIGSGGWGYGGQVLTTADALAMRARG